MPAKLESLRIREVLKPSLLKALPGSKWEKIPGSLFNVGLLDLVGSWKGHLIWIEAKLWNNHEPTALQRKALFGWAAAGATAFVAVFLQDKARMVFKVVDHPGSQHAELAQRLLETGSYADISFQKLSDTATGLGSQPAALDPPQSNHQKD